MHGETLGHPLTRTESPIETPVRALSRRRSLLVVAVSLIAALVIGLGIAVIAAFIGQRQAATSSNPWAGLGAIVLGAGIGVLVEYVFAVTAVGLGMRRRTGGRRFTLVFALVLGALHIGLFALGGLGRFTLPSVFAGVPLGMWLLLGGPMLWALPAASVRLIRRRWLVVIAAIGMIVVIILIGAQKLQADREQSTANAAYRGPAFAPSVSPGSPVDGYRLRSVKLPSPFDADGGATQISLSYIRPAAEISDEEGYTLDFRVGKGLSCGGALPVCPTVGMALGRPVLQITNAGSYAISLDSGVILLEGNLDPDQAVSILKDLKKASVDEIAALHVDVR